MDISREWCRVEEFEGRLVLLRRGYNSDSDDYEMAVEINAEDFVDDGGVGMVTARLAGESEEARSDDNWAQFCGLGKYDKPLWPELAKKIVEAIKEVGANG